MGLELRGLLLDLVPDFAVEEHEGREAFFRHLCFFCRGGGVWAQFRSQLAGRFVAPGAAGAACSGSQRLDVLLMLQRTQCGVQKGVSGLAGALFWAGSQTLAACKTLGIDADFV